MSIALVMLGTGDRQHGCHTLLNSLEQHSRIPDNIDRLMLCDFDSQPVDFAVSVPVTVDYSGLLADPVAADLCKKFFMFLLPYDYLIYLDANLICTGDVSVLWSGSFNQHPIYARNAVSPSHHFDDRVMVFNHDRQLGFHDALLYLARMRLFEGYGQTSQDLLNGYFCHTKRKVGNLPPGLNVQ